jgi:hypothetical protein
LCLNKIRGISSKYLIVPRKSGNIKKKKLILPNIREVMLYEKAILLKNFQVIISANAIFM